MKESDIASLITKRQKTPSKLLSYNRTPDYDVTRFPCVTTEWCDPGCAE